MIAYLQGTVRKKLPRSIILQVDSIGYEITLPTPLFEKLQTESQIELYIHTHVREDELKLYGMETSEELTFFRQLIEVPGIGPRLATDLLALPIKKIKGAILNKDYQTLQSVSGVGRKIAERLVTELKNKVGALEEVYEIANENVTEEVMQALLNLGYQRKHVFDILKKRPTEIIKTEDIVRYFLQHV